MDKISSKTLSRLAAIQSSFQTFFDNSSLDQISNQFNEHRYNKVLEKSSIKLKYNKKYYDELILFINKFTINNDINEFFTKYLKIKRPYKRLDNIVKAILIVGSSEILNNKDIKKKIIINDYIIISKLFLEKSEVSFINAILDNIYETKKKIE